MQNSAAHANDTPFGADAAALRSAENALAAVADLHDIDPAELTADALLEYTSLLGNIARLIEGRQVRNVGDIDRRSDTDAGFDGLAARHGSASPTALFEKITGAKNSTAYRFTRVAKHTTVRTSDTGLPLPPVFAQTGEALADGVIGLDAAEAITSTLATVLPRAVPHDVDVVEATLIGNATGAFGETPISADNLRLQAQAFCAVLDPDGVEPTAEELHEARRLTLTHRDDGSLRITGVLGPEQAAIITPVFDAHMSKRTSPTFMNAEEQNDTEHEVETRSRPQERADVFTSIVGGAAKRADAPKLHGRGPTVIVTVTRQNLETDRGAASSPGTPAPLPMGFVRQAQCDGETHEAVLGESGDVLDLGTSTRFFSTQQRLALIARDGDTCAVSDCPIPAWLCEAHHITGWANGGPTNLANGILLCWFHHRLIERGEWTIVRDAAGRPKVAPPDWYVSRRYLGKRRPGQPRSTRPRSDRDTDRHRDTEPHD